MFLFLHLWCLAWSLSPVQCHEPQSIVHQALYRSDLWSHELLIAKFRLKLKTVGKTARPFRYDLNQIPYDYTVEVRNRFQGLDLIDRVPDELWNEVHDIVQETGTKPSTRDVEIGTFKAYSSSSTCDSITDHFTLT